jgi:hypothetical protein
VLSRHDNFELEILLHGASHLFNRDYGLLDCGGVALSKARLTLLVERKAGLLSRAKAAVTAGGEADIFQHLYG